MVSLDGSLWRSTSVLLFWFVMACVCLSTRARCLRCWMNQSRRRRRISRRHKSHLLRPTRLRQKNIFLRMRILLLTGVPPRSKCTCNCYFKCPRTLSIDAIILCINIIIIITTYELINSTHSTCLYACVTHLAQNPILALYWTWPNYDNRSITIWMKSLTIKWHTM